MAVVNRLDWVDVDKVHFTLEKEEHQLKLWRLREGRKKHKYLRDYFLLMAHKYASNN